MAMKSKVSFTVIREGLARQIMLAGEQKDGTVILSFTGGGYMEDGTSHIPITSQKYSVHPSPGSPGSTIKHTLALAEEREIVTSQYRLPGPDGFAALLFGRTVPDLALDKYLAPTNREQVRIYGADIGVRTLFSFVIAAEPQFDARSLVSAFAVTSRTFSQFQIIVLTGLFDVPTLPQSDWVHMGTSTPKFAPTDVPVQARDLAANPVQQLVLEAQATLALLKGRLWERQLAAGASAFQLSALLREFRMFPPNER